MDLSTTDIVVYLAIFWVVGQIAIGFMKERSRANEAEHNELVEKISSLIHMVKVEKHGEVDYWFDADNGQFLGQGSTFDQAVEHIKSRFPNHVFLFGKDGGLAAETGWKLLPPDQMKKLVISKEF